MKLTYESDYWSVPLYSYTTTEEAFRQKVTEQVGAHDIGQSMFDTSAHAMLAYVDVLRQRVDELEEIVDRLEAQHD